MITLGSLFDGIGGFPLAAQRNGIETVWASEIESFPIKVTQERFPQMEHLGDICKIDGSKLEPVWVVSAGSPCQDVSVAGRRAGLEGQRSGLFFEMVRVVKEMRDHDRRNNARTGVDVRPRYLIWENVPGVFSSNKGEDFRTVIEEICRIADPTVTIPMPNKNKWNKCGCIMGDGFSLAWRCLDARFWGVPQRRTRCYLVCDFGNQSAAEVLFKRKGLPRHLEESRASQENPSTVTEKCLGETGNAIETYSISPYKGNQSKTDAPSCVTKSEVARTLDSSGGNPSCNQGGMAIVQAYSIREDATNGSMSITPVDVANTLQKQQAAPSSHHAQTHIVQKLYETHAHDSRVKGPVDVAPTVTARYGTGGNNTPLVQKVTGEIDCTPDGIAGAVSCKWSKGTGGPSGLEFYNLVNTPYQESVGALCASDAKGMQVQMGVQDKYIIGQYTVRRLTPLECERLQDFPNGWTNVKGGSDSARYKALGNSIAVCCAEYVMGGIKEILEKSLDNILDK